MKTYDLYLESGPRRKTTMVHVLEPLGCNVRGLTTEAALASTPDGILDFLRFLQRYGEAVDIPEGFETQVAEHVTEGYFLGNGSTSIIYQPELLPLGADELERLLGRLMGVHREIVRQAARFDALSFETKPDEAARSVREILEHVLESEQYYLRSGLGKDEALINAYRQCRKLETLSEQMQCAWALEMARMRAITETERQQVHHSGQEPWTARKMLRRMLEHGWEHLKELEVRLPED